MNNTQKLKFLKEDSETNIIGFMQKEIPIIAVWRLDFYHIAFFCKHCGRLHKHGWAGGHPNGHRVEHCCKPNSPFEGLGYYLEVQGSLWEAEE